MIRFRRQIKDFFRFGPRGFSLLEILIALAVMLVGIVGVTALFPVGLRASKMGETYTRNAIVGQQILEWLKLYSYSSLSSSTASGSEGDFSWSRTITDMSAPYDNDLKQIKVTVTWKEGGADRTEDFYTYISRY